MKKNDLVWRKALVLSMVPDPPDPPPIPVPPPSEPPPDNPAGPSGG